MSEMMMIATRGKIKATRDRTMHGIDAIDADEDDWEIEVERRWRQCGIEP